MTASSILNNLREFKKENLKSSENCILSSTSEAFNNAELTSKVTSKRLYNFKLLLSKFNKQTRSIKKFENRFNYRNFHREHLIKFREKAHMYNVVKTLSMNDHISLSDIRALNLLTSTKS